MALSPRNLKRTIFLPLTPRKLRSGTVYFGDDGRPSGDRSHQDLELSSDPSNGSPSESDQYEDLSETENSSDNNDGDGNNESGSGNDTSDNPSEPENSPRSSLHRTSTKTGEWSQETRMRIVAWREIGLSQYEIAKKLGITRATVQSILRKYNQTGTVENLSRSGRPQKLNARDLRFLDRIVTKGAESRRTPVENIRATLNKDVSTKTIRRAMKKIGISYHPAAIKPFVSKVNAKKRLDWCKEHLNWSVEDWSKVVWTDECSVEVQRSSKHAMVWRKSGERMKTDCLQPSLKSGRRTIMIWGCFQGEELGPVTVIEKGQIDSAKYCKMLGDIFLPYFRTLEKDSIFMQDNAPIHCSKYTSKWQKKNGVRTMKWPAQSPDLNPIENIWSQLKFTLDKKKLKNEKELEQAIYEEWEALRKTNNCRQLIESMPRRMKSVIKLKGMPTKY
jgi:transposase